MTSAFGGASRPKKSCLGGTGTRGLGPVKFFADVIYVSSLVPHDVVQLHLSGDLSESQPVVGPRQAVEADQRELVAGCGGEHVVADGVHLKLADLSNTCTAKPGY